MNDYLWDRSGRPDPEIVRLEALLGRHAYRGVPSVDSLRSLGVRRRRSPLFAAIAVLATAATVALAASAAYVAYGTQRAGWGVETIAGTPRVSGEPVGASTRLRVGETIVTDAESSARLGVGEIGEVDVAPNSELHLLRAGAAEHRMALRQGEIRARIWAPPRLFYVNTPSATAVDLGCAYTLRVDADGSGHVHVDHGWVSFEDAGRESFIPEGAMCETRPGVGPGTPYYADADPALTAALSILDFPPTPDVNREAALDAVLAAARPRDALTLWHLLSRVQPAERARVYDRLAAFVPPPQSVTRFAVLRGDRAALDAWWNALGLDDTSWWRLFTRPWRER